jgi:hypothetical protein
MTHYGSRNCHCVAVAPLQSRLYLLLRANSTFI